ncbi:MAG: LPS export ABC transporter permease LptF [Deltaproteobacteria bacterium]|nr:LPS export ABC transporter permease LptF [Deltaproteobacteria bacterium]
MRIISRYIFREILTPFGVTLLVFTLIFLLGNLMQLIEMIVQKGVGLWDIIRLLGYTLPFLFVYIIPMTFFISILLGFLRLSSDNEVTALKASGIGFFQLLPPVLILSLACYVLTSFTAMVAQPWGEYSLKNLIFNIAVVQAKVTLKERVFNDDFKDLVFYIQKVSSDGEMEDVFILDQRQKDVPQTIVAKKGWLIPNPRERSLNLRLGKGTIYNVSLDSKSAQNINFKTYDLILPLEQMLSSQEKRERSETELYLHELKKKIRQTSSGEKKYFIYQIEYYKKFSLPFSCLVFGLIAFPLGLQSRLAGRSWAVILGGAVFFIYYLILSLAFSLGEKGSLSPMIGLWLPNVVVGALGGYLFWITWKEKEMRWLTKIKDLMDWLKEILTKGRR